MTVESVRSPEFFGLLLERTHELRGEDGSDDLERDLLVTAAWWEERLVDSGLLEQFGKTTTIVEAAAGCLVGLTGAIIADHAIN